MGISRCSLLRQPSEIEVSTAAVSGSSCSGDEKSKSRRSNPPPDLPTRYSGPLSGALPVSASTHVARISSGVQRASPSAGGTNPSFGHTSKPRRSASVCFATASSSALSRARLIAPDPREGFALQLGLEQGAAQLAAQPPHLAQPHGAEHLQELVSPGGGQVREPLHRPARIGALELDPAGIAVAARSGQAPLQRDADRDVERRRIEAADDGLREVLGADDPTAP